MILRINPSPSAASSGEETGDRVGMVGRMREAVEEWAQIELRLARSERGRCRDDCW